MAGQRPHASGLDTRKIPKTRGSGGAPESTLLSHATAPRFLDTSTTENYELEFSVENEEQNYTGEICTVTFIFEASQEGFNHGEAFYDTDTYSVTLYGEDFGSGAGGDTPTVDDCEGEGWKSEIFAEFNFENQGHCVSHFASEGVSTDARGKNRH